MGRFAAFPACSVLPPCRGALAMSVHLRFCYLLRGAVTVAARKSKAVRRALQAWTRCGHTLPHAHVAPAASPRGCRRLRSGRRTRSRTLPTDHANASVLVWRQCSPVMQRAIVHLPPTVGTESGSRFASCLPQERKRRLPPAQQHAQIWSLVLLGPRCLASLSLRPRAADQQRCCTSTTVHCSMQRSGHWFCYGRGGQGTLQCCCHSTKGV